MDTATLDMKEAGSYSDEEIDCYFHKAAFNVTYVLYRQEEPSMKKRRVDFCIKYFTALREVSSKEHSLAIDSLVSCLKRMESGKGSSVNVMAALSAVVNQKCG
jgi:hypothetical protein